MGVYLSCQSSKEEHPALPLLSFVMNLLRSNKLAYDAVLKSGFLDVLLCIYIGNFTDDYIMTAISKKALNPHRVPEGRQALLESGRAILSCLSLREDTQKIISLHPVCVFWPKDDSLLAMYGYRVTEREAKWRDLGTELVARRLRAIEFLFIAKGSGEFSERDDASIDLEEFSR